MLHTLSNGLQVKRALATATITATTNGVGIDARTFERALLAISVGVMTGTAPTLDIKVQESDDNATYTDVPGATFTQITTANDDAVYLMDVDLAKRRRYVRAVFTVGGTSPSIPLGALWLLGRGRYEAVTQDNPVRTV